MRFRSVGLALATILTLDACASGNHPQRTDHTGPNKTNKALAQPMRLLAHARSLQAKAGCKTAAPVYRVAASFGDGYEIAQYELGACLLKVSGADTYETGLFREEAFFWLRRSAWAGNARAQWRLATSLGLNPITVAAKKEEAPIIGTALEALGWAFIYADNSSRELYALPPVRAERLAQLEAALSPEELIEAQTFAQNFTPIKLAAFEPPTFARNNSRRENDQGAGRKGRRGGGGKGRR